MKDHRSLIKFFFVKLQQAKATMLMLSVRQMMTFLVEKVTSPRRHGNAVVANDKYLR